MSRGFFCLLGKHRDKENPYGWPTESCDKGPTSFQEHGFAHPRRLPESSDVRSALRGFLRLLGYRHEKGAKGAVGQTGALPRNGRRLQLPGPDVQFSGAGGNERPHRGRRWSAVIALSVVLLIQALVFGDGGITALGANCCNMAIAMPFISYGVFRLAGGAGITRRRTMIAAFLAGYIGLCAAAVLAGIEFGIQPLIASGPDGRPLYAPYPLKIAVPAMALEHLFCFGIIEGVVTALLLGYLLKNQPGLIYGMRQKTYGNETVRPDK